MARCSALRMAAKAGLKCRCRKACSTSTHWLAASGASSASIVYPCLLEFAGLTGLSARRGVLWHLSKMLCPNPRRTTHKPVAGGNRLPGICPRRANAWRGGSRRAAPTNGLAVAEQSSTPGAVQPPPHLSGPASRGSCPADDGVPLQKTSRLFCLLFELPRLANQGQPQTGRGWRGQRQNGPDKAYDDSRYWRARSLL